MRSSASCSGFDRKLNYLTRNGNHQGAVALTAAIEYVDVYDMLAGIPEDETPLVVVFDG
ncbi:MAG: hypothetical protein ACLUEV_05145 [Alistipes sp.]